MKRRHFVASGLTVAPLTAPTWAQSYPSRPINMVVGFAAGGGVDFLVRSIAPALSASYGQPIVVDNRPGASSIIAAQYMARAPGDGYTFFAADSGALILNSALYSNLPYDPVRDFAPVSMLVRAPMLVVASNNFPPNNLPPLVEYANQNRGKLSYASPGRGTAHALGMEQLKQRAKFFAVEIPYRGAGPAIQDVISGQVPIAVIDSIVALPQIRGGKIKVLAALTPSRLSALPNVPTAAEQGIPDAECYGWTGVVAPKSTPADIVASMSAEIAKALRTPDVNKRFVDLGLEPFPTTPADFGSFINSENKRWLPLIRSLNLSLD